LRIRENRPRAIRYTITVSILGYTMAINRATGWCIWLTIQLVNNTITISTVTVTNDEKQQYHSKHSE